MTSVEQIARSAEALTRMAHIAESLDERPELIRTAREGGMTWPVIARALRVSVSTVKNLSKVESSDLTT
jgi:DNA-binding NarL/FixJ family response regulator